MKGLSEKQKNKLLNSSPLFGCDKKSSQYYKGIKIKADTDLHEQLADILANRIKFVKQDKKLTVLDWGCGEGALSQRLYDMGCEVISVDINKSDFKAIGPKFYQVDFNDNFGIKRFVKDNSYVFDIILCVEIIEHIKDTWGFINNIKILCKPLHTHILITTPNISSWWARFMFLMKGDLWGFDKNAWMDPGHINPISEVEMNGILKESGFECLDVWPVGKLPILWFYNWKRVLISFIMLPVYFFMEGRKKGWGICYHSILKR